VTDEERFWAKVDKSDPDGCWRWTGATDGGHYYGSFMFEGKVRRAHRVSWTLAYGEAPPEGMDLDHLCRVTLCVRPDHLEVVTHHENILRGESLQAQNARKTHCIRGHLLAGDNLLNWRRAREEGARICGACYRLRRAPALAHVDGLDRERVVA